MDSGGLYFMKFPNALTGLKKIYASQMLLLVVGILDGVASVFGDKASEQVAGAGNVTAETALGVMIPLLLSGLLTIVAACLELFGLKDAAEDDEQFKKGYTYALIGLIFSIVIAVLNYLKISGGMLSDFAETVSDLIEVLVSFYVITGIKSLAEKLGNKDMVNSGKKTFNIYAASTICASLVELLMKVLKGDTKMFVIGIFGAITLALIVVAYFLYLRYLGKAKKMLG